MHEKRNFIFYKLEIGRNASIKTFFLSLPCLNTNKNREQKKNLLGYSVTDHPEGIKSERCRQLVI